MRVLLFIALMLYSGDALAGPRLSGQQTVSTAGTAERIHSATVYCSTIIFSADENNLGVVVVGDVNVDATQATRKGLQLFPGQTEYYAAGASRMDLRHVWVDAVNNDDGVAFTCLN